MPVFNNHHIHFPHFSFDNTRELRLIYLVRIARSLVNNLAFFFLPLFIYQMAPQLNLRIFQGLSDFQKGMYLIALFFILDRGVGLLTVIPVGKVITKIGYGRSFVVSQLIAILTLVVLKMSIATPVLIFLAAIIDGFERNWFWNSYQTLAVENSHKSKMGQDLGIIQFIINFLTMISPAIGGVIIGVFGYESLFLSTSIIMLVGVVISLSMKQNKIRDRVGFDEFREWIAERRFVRLAMSFGGKYFHDAAIFVWPLYVFILLGTAEKVGFLYTFSLFLAMVLSFFIGFQVDHNKSKKPFFLSGAVMSILWIVRLSVVSIWSVAITDMISRISQNYHGIFFDRKMFIRSRGKEVFSYFVYHEFILNFSAVLFWIVFGLLFGVFDIGWEGMFALGAVGVMLSMLIKEHK